MVTAVPPLISGTKIDIDGTDNYFETDQALGSGAAPSLYIDISPENPPHRFVMDTVRYYMHPENAVTYQLYLLESPRSDIIEQYSDVVFDSGAAQADDTIYMCVRGDKLPITVDLTRVGRLYYMLDWSGAPGNTKGFIQVRGRMMI